MILSKISRRYQHILYYIFATNSRLWNAYLNEEVEGTLCPVDTKIVKKVLQTYKKRLLQIHERMLELYEEVRNLESCMMSMEDSFKIHENTEEKELRGLLLRHKNFVEMQIFEVYLEMHRLNEEEESIHRIWRCFQALEEKEKDVLRQIYVEGNSYKEAEIASKVSHKTFETMRANGVRRIIEWYQSDLSNEEIICKKMQNQSEAQGE